MFMNQPFMSHSGKSLDWKIDCDCLTNEDLSCLAKVISKFNKFKKVVGIPQGGIRLAEYLQKYCVNNQDLPVLIVDDVLTTGKSMEEWKREFESNNYWCIGVVIFCRKFSCPGWIVPIFKLPNVLCM